jgi:hypothetical protein
MGTGVSPPPWSPNIQIIAKPLTHLPHGGEGLDEGLKPESPLLHRQKTETGCESAGMEA